jgi:hypothetical protein
MELYEIVINPLNKDMTANELFEEVLENRKKLRMDKENLDFWTVSMTQTDLEKIEQAQAIFNKSLSVKVKNPIHKILGMDIIVRSRLNGRKQVHTKVRTE